MASGASNYSAVGFAGPDGQTHYFHPNNSAFRAIAVGPEVTAIVTEIATKALGIAEGLSADFAKTGDYAKSFEVRTEIIPDLVGRKTPFGAHPVVAGILENTSGHAAAVEWGNKDDSKAHHVLGRTLDALAND